MKKTTILIDGGYLRHIMLDGKWQPDAQGIEKIAHAIIDGESEELHKILYYDCRRFIGKRPLPISGKEWAFKDDDRMLDELSRLNFFAVRLGELKFRGWELAKKTPPPNRPLADSDYKPIFEQKGVDMRIGLDIASIAEQRIVSRIILMSGDTDLTAALKHARKRDIQTAAVALPGEKLAGDFLSHTDFVRALKKWPKGFTPFKPKSERHP